MVSQILVSALPLLAASCDKASLDRGLPEERVIRVSTEVGVMTRGEYSSDNLPEFDLTVLSANARYSYDRVTLAKEGSSWTPATMMLWEGNGKTADLYAFAPCFSPSPEDAGNEGSVSPAGLYFGDEVKFVLNTTQSMDDNSSDVLYWGGSGFNPVNDLVDGKVCVQFKHLMCKLNLKIELGTEFGAPSAPAANPVSDVRLVDVCCEAALKWNKTTSDGNIDYSEISVVTDDGCMHADVNLYEVKWTPADGGVANSTAEFESILIPQDITGDRLKILFKVDGIPYEWTLDSDSSISTLQSGVAYDLTIRVGDGFVTRTGLTCASWDGGDKLDYIKQ